MSEPPVVFDGGMFVSEFAGDPAVRQLIPRFLADVPEKLANAGRCCEAEDWAAMAPHIHQLKGAAGVYGFVYLSTLCEVLEGQLTAQTVEKDRIVNLFTKLQDFCAKLIATY